MTTLGRFGHKSLPTYYKGITFRSRLEARWAIILDQLGIAWEYEPEALIIEGAHFPDLHNPPTFCYLPDFYLPEYKAFMEVKGFLDEPEYWKIMRIAHQLVPNDYDADHKFLLAGELFQHNQLPALTALWNHKGWIMASRRIPLKSDYDRRDYWFDSNWQVGDDGSTCFLEERRETIDDICWQLIHQPSAGPSNLKMIEAANFARSARFDRGHNV